jgi:hypothetical protein
MLLQPTRPFRCEALLGGILAFTSTLAASAASNPPAPSAHVPPAVRLAAPPLAFEANSGQAPGDVRFVAHGQGYAIELTDSGAVVALQARPQCPPLKDRPQRTPSACAATPGRNPDLVRLEILSAQSASAHRSPAGEGPLPGRVNYFIGNDPSRWRAGVPTYAKVRYAGVYPGVDLVYYGNQRQLEYDFVVAPGADPARIALSLSGAQGQHIDAATGDLVIGASNGELRLIRPATYQVVRGKRVDIQSSFKLLAENKIGFSVGAHDSALPLVIDPTLTYATFLGGSANDEGIAIAVDSSGSAYVAGNTNSTDFPTLDPLQSANGNPAKGTVFVTKFTPDGSALVYSTYLGGTGGDSAAGIAIDADGDAYIAGNTSSIDFPLVNPLQSKNNGAVNSQGTTFVAKLNPTGAALVFSTYLGGSGGDKNAGIAVDAQQNVYIAGTTLSTDFPLQNAMQSTNNCAGSCGGNIFVSEIESSGSALVYSTYLGGSGFSNPSFGYMPAGGDTASGIAVDADGEAVVAGTTYSTDFPVSADAFQPQNITFCGVLSPCNGTSGFVTKFNAEGTGFVFSTYFGGPGFAYLCGEENEDLGDSINALALDKSGNVYVTGSTYGGIPTVHAIQGYVGAVYSGVDNFNGTAYSTNAFITDFRPDGSSLLYSTYLGGTGSNPCGPLSWFFGQCGFIPDDCYVEFASGDAGTGIAVDGMESIYVTGLTSSADFPFSNPIGGQSPTIPFIAKLHSDGSPPVYSSWLDAGLASVTTDTHLNAWVTGGAGEGSFTATPGAFQPQANGGYDAYAARVTTAGKIQLIAFDLPNSITFGKSLNLAGRAFATSGLPVQYRITGGNASMNGNILSANWVGGVTIQAFQPGNATYSGSVSTKSLSVVPATVAVKAMNASMTYGGAVPSLGYYPIASTTDQSSVSGEPSLSSTAKYRSRAGTYPIEIGQGTLSVAFPPPPGGETFSISDPNYTFAFKNATLTIKRAELSVTAKSSTIHQGQRIEPELAYTITGFVNGDEASKAVRGKPILETTAKYDSPPGKYPIVVKLGTLSARNYKFTLEDGELTIVKK